MRVCCVVFLYLTHTVLNSGGQSYGFVPLLADGLGSTPAEEESGRFACGEACFDTDAILSRAQENDPFLAFLSLVTLTPVLSAEPEELVRSVRLRPADKRPPETLHPHLRFLAHASQILC